MGAEPLVEAQVGAFGGQGEIEIRQDRRKTVRVRDLDLPLAVAGAHAVAPRAVRPSTFEQAGIVNALEAALVPLVVDDGDALGVRQEDAYDGDVAFDVWPEIAEGVGMAP